MLKKKLLPIFKNSFKKISPDFKNSYPNCLKLVQQQLFRSKSAFLINNRSFSSLTERFSDSTKEFECQKIKDDFNELQETLFNNISEIKQILPGRGIHVSAFFLKSFSEIEFEDPEVFEILYDNIDKTLNTTKNPEVVLELLEGIDKARDHPEKIPPVPQNILSKISLKIREVLPLLKSEFLDKAYNLLKNFENENVPELNCLINEFPKVATKDIKAILDALNINEKYQKTQDLLSIIDIDWDNHFIELRNLVNRQNIRIYGCYPQPTNTLDKITQYIESKKGKINLLMLEDSPLFFGPPVPPDIQDNYLLASEYMRQHFTLLSTIDGNELEEYVSGYTKSSDIFEFNTKEDTVYTRINSKVKVPSELGTVAHKFHKNSDKTALPKIVLIDLSLQEIIGRMISNFKLHELKHLVSLLNYCTLLEKLRFAKVSTKFGCQLCNKAMPLALPKDMISIVTGDPEYPSEERAFFLARNIFEALSINSYHKEGVAVVGSYHLIDILKDLVELSYQYKDNKIEPFSREEIMRKTVFNLNPQLDKDEQIEKLAILESIHQSIDASLIERGQLEHDEDYAKYIDCLDRYGFELSYEKLTEKNKEIKISPGDCMADVLVFGDSNPIEGTEKELDLGLSETIQSIVRPTENLEPSESLQKIKLKK